MAAEVCYNSNSRKRWFHFRLTSNAGGGTTSEAGYYEVQAKRAAAQRLDVAEDDLICTGWDPFYKYYTI